MIEFHPNASIYKLEHEIEGLGEIKLTKEDDPDCGHATLLRIGSRGTIAFDFRYNKALSTKHIETAEQSYDSAEFSFNKKNWSSFVDNLFSAAELLAKSTLLLMPDPKFRKKATHIAIGSYIKMLWLASCGFLGLKQLLIRMSRKARKIKTIFRSCCFMIFRAVSASTSPDGI